jgi:transcriptional/translational regulatory protein YebC/TACO1
VERAIEDAKGELGSQVVKEIIYELRPGRRALIVEVATDNKNRTGS